jgi:uncharacterized protein DUF4386
MALGSGRYAPRVAGFAFLFLIATDLGSLVLWRGVRTTNGISDTLISISENAARIRLGLVLSMVASITTLVLAAMLYAMVAHQDRNLAILALSCRAVEAGLYASGMLNTLALLSLSRSSSNDVSSVHVLGDLLRSVNSMSTNIGATFFAAGSTLYCYLLLKARSIPVPLATIGLVGSLIILVGIPLQTALGRRTFAGASAVIWAPIAVFEVTTGVWLLVKGTRVSAPVSTEQAAARV